MGSDMFRFLLFLITRGGLMVVTQLEGSLLGQGKTGGIGSTDELGQFGDLLLVEDAETGVRTF